MSVPDMRTPIAHCLAYPDRVETKVRRLDLAAIGSLSFERPDFERVPALRVAMDCMKAGGSLPTVLNAANEIAVEAFLAGRISFHQIASMVEQVCEAAVRRGDDGEPATVGDALEIDRMTRHRAREALM
jgi:1-deoxy-D-xylulose-5-phosphate reductoisomerase